MNSCLYDCSVMHHRLAPKVHHFQHGIFMCYLDLDELEAITKKIRWFSWNRKNIYSFQDADHEPSGRGVLKQRIVNFLRLNGVEFDPSGRVMLLTLPRVLGYIFNPISIYFCFDSSGSPVCSIAEVGNTFHEKKLYLLGPETQVTPESFQKLLPKHFYVSPFSDLDLSFDFRFKVPGEKLDLKIDDREGSTKSLITTLTGQRVPLTNRHLAWLTLKFPLVTLKVIFLIHWHAFLLWLKRVPFHRKAANPALQQNVLRPHSTLITK